MFDGSGLPPLEDEVFEEWLERGRQNPLGYRFLLVVWDEFELAHHPVYTSVRDDIELFQRPSSRERFIAAYDLYSESRIG